MDAIIYPLHGSLPPEMQVTISGISVQNIGLNVHF